MGVPGSRSVGPATKNRILHCQFTIWPELLFRWGIHEQTAMDQRIEATEVEQEAQVNRPETRLLAFELSSRGMFIPWKSRLYKQ